MGKHPRDAFITVYGRKPVLEALEMPGVRIAKVLVSDRARGSIIADIEKAARRAGVELRHVPAKEVTRISRNAKQDQGVAADVEAPRMDALASFLERNEQPAGPLVVLDGITTPGNVGMIIRSAVAAGAGGVVIPRVGCPEIGPQVVKGSAGVAFRAVLLRAPDPASALDALGRAGYRRLGLAGEADCDLYDADLTGRVAIVLGNETHGLGEASRARLDGTIRIPMSGGVESLNVAVAAAVVVYEALRRAREAH